MNTLKNIKTNKEKVVEKQKKKLEKEPPKFVIKKQMKKRIKNSQIFSNIKSVEDDGLIELKTGEVASLIEVKAIIMLIKHQTHILRNSLNSWRIMILKDFDIDPILCPKCGNQMKWQYRVC